jgi:hypothetical protein
MIKMKKNVTPGETPEKISVMQIDQNLQDGISKPEMAIKYGIKPWEVDEMFKHPFLKGKRPARKRTLSFTFVDDTEEINGEVITTKTETEEYQDKLDSAQITLEEAIDDAIESVKEGKDQMQETQESIIDILSPTEFETPEETLLKAANELDAEEDADWANVTEIEEEDDDTFEL